ncbi:MAG: hypothetical protein K0B05_13660 [Bacteroidales bacterium]|nr:hypothetical protein [Bacteroidales bacterium]
MRRPFSGILYLIAAATWLTTFSCAPEACFEETVSYVKASFYVNETGKYQAPDTLTLYGTGNEESKIYYRNRNIQPALFPLNAGTPASSFVIIINGIADTIGFTYTSYPQMISKECGYTFNHDIDSYTSTKHIIDTVIIRNRSITTVNEENIRIFY